MEELELADRVLREDQAGCGSLGRMAGMCEGRGDPREVMQQDMGPVGLKGDMGDRIGICVLSWIGLRHILGAFTDPRVDLA